MRIPKRYGQSKISTCPFCTRTATQKNAQGIDVCAAHTKQVLEEIKCTCGSWLEQRSGKFGPYFNCINCGNLNFNKVMEIKALQTEIKEVPVVLKKSVPVRERKEITISSKDVEYFD